VAAGDLVLSSTGHEQPARVRAYDARTGTLVWTSPKARITHGPLTTPGGIVVATTNGTLLGFAP
jgi:hypothetical protein